MFQLRRILLSGLVALLMVGMVVASDMDGAGDDSVDRIHIGAWTGSDCVESPQWQCLHLEFTFVIDLPFL